MAGTPSRQEARRAVALFPLVGALLGLVVAAVWTFSRAIWAGQPLVAGALALAAGTLVTGGRSLGGLARAADGVAAFLSDGSQGRAFAVMRDPRRGTVGLVSVAVIVAVKVAFLAALPPGRGWPGLIVAAVLGRWACGLGYCFFPLASAPADEGGGQALADAGGNEFFLSTALTIVCAALLPGRGLLLLGVVAVVIAPAAQMISRLLGGLSVPLNAAWAEVAEVLALACLAIR